MVQNPWEGRGPSAPFDQRMLCFAFLGSYVLTTGGVACSVLLDHRPSGGRDEWVVPG